MGVHVQISEKLRGRQSVFCSYLCNNASFQNIYFIKCCLSLNFKTFEYKHSPVRQKWNILKHLQVSMMKPSVSNLTTFLIFEVFDTSAETSYSYIEGIVVRD